VDGAVSVSALVRARDEVAGIGALLDRLHAKTVPVEVVVTDSGSTDGTLAAVRARGVEPVTIAPGDFTYGRALNRAAAWHWQCEGRLVRLDPALAVHHSHAGEGPLRTFRRARGDVAAVRSFRPVPTLDARAALGEWWRGPWSHRSALRARVDPRRAAVLAGEWAGLR
jgi:glycosyltransferase involved in cell wall biosynthesis